MEGLDLGGEAAVDVVEAEVASRGVAGLDNVEEVGVGVGVEEGVGRGVAPLGVEVWVEIREGVAVDGGEGAVGGEVEVVFRAGEEGEEVFFELEADEFFGAEVAHCSGAGGVEGVPGVGYGLGEEVDPAAVGGGEGEGGPEGGGGYGGCGFVELGTMLVFGFPCGVGFGFTLMSMSL